MIDSLVKDENPAGAPSQRVIEKEIVYVHDTYPMFTGMLEYEYKSKRTVFGVPLVHINIGRGKRVANGIFAIGNLARGVVALGFASMGVFSFGVVSLGAVSFSALSLGVLSFGAIAVGCFALGDVALGFVATGGLAIGIDAIGGAAIAKEVAVGGYANGYTAIEKVVEGVRTLEDTGLGNRFPSGTLRREEVQTFLLSSAQKIPRLILGWLTAAFPG